jgi:hypothetical protein
MQVTIDLPEYVDCPNNIWIIDPSWAFDDLLNNIINESWISGTHDQVDVSIYKLQCGGQDVTSTDIVCGTCGNGHTIKMMRK